MIGQYFVFPGIVSDKKEADWRPRVLQSSTPAWYYRTRSIQERPYGVALEISAGMPLLPK